MLTSGIAPIAQEPEQAITSSYQKGINDEFIKPVKIGSEGSFVPIEDNDSVIIFNFRRDRIDQLTRALILPHFNHFNRRKILEDQYVVTYTTYESKELPILSAFHAKKISSPLAAILASNGLKQFHIAETEKYAHVTYFLNGGIEQPFPGEDRVIIRSPEVATYNLYPQMSAYKVTETVVEKIRNEEYDFIVVNFANADMVGHTGDLHATMVACETVDQCIGKIIEENRKRGIITIVTADHGNAEQMVDPNTGEPYTEHTTNPVPFIIIPNEQTKIALNLETGNLANIVPTILTLMGIPITENIIGSTLTVKEANADRTT
jgi:2,3-bisphosphoglycerate-independent phosphoglycerate mutase